MTPSKVEEYIETLIGSDATSPELRKQLLRDGVDLLKESFDYLNADAVTPAKPGSFKPKAGIMFLPTKAREAFEVGISGLETMAKASTVSQQRFAKAGKDLVKMLLTVQNLSNRGHAV